MALSGGRKDKHGRGEIKRRKDKRSRGTIKRVPSLSLRHASGRLHSSMTYVPLDTSLELGFRAGNFADTR